MVSRIATLYYIYNFQAIIKRKIRACMTKCDTGTAFHGSAEWYTSTIGLWFFLLELICSHWPAIRVHSTLTFTNTF